MRKIISLFLAIALMVTPALCGCNDKKEKFKDYSFDYFDTVTTIIGYEKTKDIFDENCDKIKEKLYEYHKLYTIYNRYDSLNNLCELNTVTSGEHKKLKVDKKIIDLLDFSFSMYELTDKKVNIAMGSVLSIWHNYREDGLNHPENANLPPMDKLTDASKHTNIKDVIIDREENTVYLNDSEMLLDVGAIAKGYAVEQTALWMEKEGISGYLLNVGGNIRTIGKTYEGDNWKRGIENPDTDNEEEPYIAYLEIADKALVTSGSYQRFYTVNGNNYHHIIDPETLMPSEYFWSVSVLCNDSGVADALSTALFSMPLEEGQKLIERLEDTEAMWVTLNGEKNFSKGFEEYLMNE